MMNNTEEKENSRAIHSIRKESNQEKQGAKKERLLTGSFPKKLTSCKVIGNPEDRNAVIKHKGNTKENSGISKEIEDTGKKADGEGHIQTQNKFVALAASTLEEQ
ncbi:hypothetical protein HAX54_046415 [Datura stramonium]|uniref:Uncharacterized protein n=1 Tax=Datura stramonium TaxID=4076 RepID=A0ABS8SST3_DATST|nr:hypothetical protein [Datura stramonium]